MGKGEDGGWTIAPGEERLERRRSHENNEGDDIFGHEKREHILSQTSEQESRDLMRRELKELKRLL
jgi:hypothetical protein